MAKCAFAVLAPAAALTIYQLVSVGRVTALVFVLDVIAGALLPFGALSLALALIPPRGENPPGEAGGRGGGRRLLAEVAPLPPSGGLEIDWERFAAEVYAYAQARDPVV